MLYIYLHMDAIRWVDVEVHAIKLVEGVCVLLCQQLLLERTSVQMKLDKRQRGSYEIGQLMWRQPGTRANCLLSYVCARVPEETRGAWVDRHGGRIKTGFSQYK